MKESTISTQGGLVLVSWKRFVFVDSCSSFSNAHLRAAIFPKVIVFVCNWILLTVAPRHMHTFHLSRHHARLHCYSCTCYICWPRSPSKSKRRAYPGIENPVWENASRQAATNPPPCPQPRGPKAKSLITSSSGQFPKVFMCNVYTMCIL